MALSSDSPWLVADPAGARALCAAGAHTLIVVPLALRGTPMGLLSVYRTGGADSCNEDDVGLVLDAASHAALCIDNARLFTREHTVAATVQRHRLTLYPACSSQPSMSVCDQHIRYTSQDGLRRRAGGVVSGSVALRSASSSAWPVSTPDRMLRATRSSSATWGLDSE